mgnify:CR=1 FL=1|jgi:uncharacterized protein with NRDE domain
MCLLVVAWRSHAVHRVVLAANRDEYHGRAAAPMAVWNSPPHILAGRDLQAGGAWLGVDRHRRFGIITNYREMTRAGPGAPSRGELIPRYLDTRESAGEYLARLQADAARYAGFSLLLGDHDQLWYASNRIDPFARQLEPGIYGLSNHFLDTPWPKLLRVRARMQEALATAHSPGIERHLFAALEDRTRAELHDLPATGVPPEWEMTLSSPFIVHPEYGTRCATVALLGSGEADRVIERRYDPCGNAQGEDEFQLNELAWREPASAQPL